MRCDSHVHVIGPLGRHPQVPRRTYTAGVAALGALQRNGAERGIGRFVIVQPSFYGTDNSATLEALHALGGQGLAVAVIDPEATPREALDDLHRRGVRGLRINLYSGPGAPDNLAAAFAAQAAVAGTMGWHVEMIANIGTLLASEGTIAASPAPVVIDHYGLYGGTRPGSPEGGRFLALLRRPHVWIKLSAPYRVSDDPLETHPDPAWLSAILEAAHERCVWGSDWPWTPAHDQHRGPDVELPFRPLSYAGMVDDFLAALPSDAARDAIMVHNPARLYGF